MPRPDAHHSGTDPATNVVKSAGRVFEVLELFDGTREAMTGTAIARALDYPASSTVALLKSMVSLGYVSFDAHERTYFPTLRLATVTRWLEDSYFVEGHFLELMDDLADATGEAIILCWPDNFALRFTRIKAASKDFAMPEIGARLPLFHSVPGLTSLMLRRDADIARLAAAVNADSPDRPVELPRAMEHINKFRHQGYGLGYDFFREGLSNISWALRPLRSSRAVVVSILGPTDRLRAESQGLVKAASSVIKRYAAG